MTDRIYTFKTFTKKKKCEICGKMFKPNTRTQNIVANNVIEVL